MKNILYLLLVFMCLNAMITGIQTTGYPGPETPTATPGDYPGPQATSTPIQLTPTTSPDKPWQTPTPTVDAGGGGVEIPTPGGGPTSLDIVDAKAGLDYGGLVIALIALGSLGALTICLMNRKGGGR